MPFTLTAGQKAQSKLAALRMHCMAEGGSRGSKTFGWVEAMITRAMLKRSQHLIVRRYFKDARQAFLIGSRATIPEVMRIAFPGVSYDVSHTDSFVTLPPWGSTIWIGGMDTGERTDKVLGREYSDLLFNEASQMPYEAVTTFLSRLAERSGLRLRAFYDQNPPTKTHWTYQVFHKGTDPQTRGKAIPRWAELYGVVHVDVECNRGNIAQGYIEDVLEGLPDRQRRRFRLGEYTEDIEGALFDQTTIDTYRITPDQLPALQVVAIGVDPSVSHTRNSHETGIVCGAKGADGHYYILDDESQKAHASEWGRRVVKLWTDRRADHVTGETNNGGDLVELNIRNTEGGANVPFVAVWASRGKAKRAEPVATLYKRGLVHHVGEFRFLEDEMTSYDPSQPESDENPANRLDAAVWLLSDLAGMTDGAYTDRDMLKECAV